MNKKEFKVKEFVNDVYKKKNRISFDYFDDNKEYKVSCILNWDSKVKNEFIKKVDEFNKELKKIPKCNKKESEEVLERYFNDINDYFLKKQIKKRTHRLNKLYIINTPNEVIGIELKLLIILLLINIFAIEDSVDIKVTAEVLPDIIY